MEEYYYDWMGHSGGSSNNSNSGGYCNHDWVWYQGFHMVRYYFCSKCDEKNLRRRGPNGEEPFTFESESDNDKK